MKKNAKKIGKKKEEKQEKPFVIGIIGPIASGKDAISNHVAEKYGFRKISTGDFLRREAVKRGIKVSREALRKLQRQIRREYGEDYLINKSIKEINELGLKKVSLEGLRTPIDVELAKERLGAKIILVDVDAFTRFMRQKRRERHGYSKTYQQFLHEDAIENATFDLHKTFKMADYKLDNSGTIPETNRNMDKLMKKIIREHNKKTRKK